MLGKRMLQLVMGAIGLALYAVGFVASPAHALAFKTRQSIPHCLGGQVRSDSPFWTNDCAFVRSVRQAQRNRANSVPLQSRCKPFQDILTAEGSLRCNRHMFYAAELCTKCLDENAPKVGYRDTTCRSDELKVEYALESESLSTEIGAVKLPPKRLTDNTYSPQTMVSPPARLFRHPAGPHD